MKTNITKNANPIVTWLGKPTEAITKEDIIKYVMENEIEMLNFMYPASDGRLKSLNFVITDEDYLRTILTYGERIDGSNIFPFIEAGNSDLYVIPRFRTAFLDPFADLPTICLLCSYFDKDGMQLKSSPEYTLNKANEVFTQETGLVMEAMAELEYYVIAEEENFGGLYGVADQRGYHESAPFAKFNEFRANCMQYIARTGGIMKYGHSEVGNFTLDGKVYEQNEIEFLPTCLEKAADTVVIAKWVIWNLAFQYGLDVSFAPKIIPGEAGSGMHVHMRFMKDGENVTLKDGKLSDVSRKAIAGLITLAPSITAFGNTNPTSYLRLVPHQEAPTNICWGDRNRSVLIRVPLGWTMKPDMSATVNPNEKENTSYTEQKQTFEMRSPDCTADIYELLAGLCVACRHGLSMPNGLELAEKTYVDVNIHSKENQARLATLEQLPDSCFASADQLERQRAIYEERDVFSPQMIDQLARKLRAYNDQNLRKEMEADPAVIRRLVDEYFYY
jgi:Glutamine synthetase